MLRPLVVHFRFGLWLPIFRYSAQYFAILHYLFSLHRSRPAQRDFNPVDMHCYFFFPNVLFVLLSFLCFEAHVTDSVLKNGASTHGCMRVLSPIIALTHIDKKGA